MGKIEIGTRLADPSKLMYEYTTGTTLKHVFDLKQWDAEDVVKEVALQDQQCIVYKREVHHGTNGKPLTVQNKEKIN